MYLAEVAARRNRLDEALVGFAAARTALHDLGFPGAVAELQSLVARVCAELHDEPAARAAIAEAESIAQALPPETVPTNLWWNLAAACALLGGAANDAERFAQIAARTFGDNALELSPEDAESYSRLPWHIDTFALLAGREVSLRLAGRANGVILR
jgi:transcriptional regulator with AAA-type ATPase domain